MSSSPYFVLEGGTKEKMTLICVCQPWHLCTTEITRSHNEITQLAYTWAWNGFLLSTC